MTPLVSIIIPVYNGEKYLLETLQSALDQSWSNLEIIVVNDGSTDSSAEIVRDLNSNKIQLLNQENKGASTARNLGLKRASGKFIQFLDADDLLSTDKIKDQVLLLEEKPGHIAVCSTIHFEETENHLNNRLSAYEEQYIPVHSDPAEFLIKLWGGYDNTGSMIQPNAWLTPMILIKKAGFWNEELTLDDDGEFFCRVILQSQGIVKTDGAYNYYRKYNHKKSLSANFSEKSLTSLLKSAISKKNHLLAKSTTNSAKIAVNKNLFSLITITYPEYPQLTKMAEKELIPIKDFKFHVNLGGKGIQIITTIFGWKFAKRMQAMLKQVKHFIR